MDVKCARLGNFILLLRERSVKYGETDVSRCKNAGIMAKASVLLPGSRISLLEENFSMLNGIYVF